MQALTRSDFVKSETQHHPPNHRCWHDTYKSRQGEFDLYLKLAGETLVERCLPGSRRPVCALVESGPGCAARLCPHPCPTRCAPGREVAAP